MRERRGISSTAEVRKESRMSTPKTQPLDHQDWLRFKRFVLRVGEERARNVLDIHQGTLEKLFERDAVKLTTIDRVMHAIRVAEGEVAA